MPVAIITGASRGIGRGITLRLAADVFNVVVKDILPQKSAIDNVVCEIQAHGREAHGIVADVSGKEQVEAMVAETVNKFGSLEVMVANAGVLETSSLLEMTVRAMGSYNGHQHSWRFPLLHYRSETIHQARYNQAS